MSVQTRSKAIFLKNYPQGLPAADQFELREIDLPPIGAGEMLLRTVWMSVDPYMRGRMRPDVEKLYPAFLAGRAAFGRRGIGSRCVEYRGLSARRLHVVDFSRRLEKPLSQFRRASSTQKGRS